MPEGAVDMDSPLLWLYRSALAFDAPGGSIVGIDMIHWRQAEALRQSLGVEIPSEVCLLTREDGCSAWLRDGLFLLFGGKVCRAFACDVAELALPFYDAAFPSDSRTRDGIMVARAFARGEASERELGVAVVAAWAVIS